MNIARPSKRSLFALLSLFILSQPCSAQEKPDPIVACKHWTRIEWLAYLKQNINEMKINTDSYKVESILNKEFRNSCYVMTAVFRECEKNLRAAGLYETTARVREFFRQCGRLVVPQTGSLSLISQAENYKAQPASIMELPLEFQKGFPTDWIEITTRNKWLAKTFNSSLRDEERIVVVIPSRDFDQWILRVPSADMFDLITVQKNSLTDGKPLEKPILHFREFSSIGGKLVPSNQTEDCSSCHLSGLVQIPVRFEHSAENSEAMEMNKKINSYGLPIRSLPNTANLDGPPMSHPKYQCANCHNGHRRGVINLHTDPLIIKSRLLRMKTMPPGEHLTDAERETIFTEMIHGYQSELREWLLSSIDEKIESANHCEDKSSNAFDKLIDPILKQPQK